MPPPSVSADTAKTLLNEGAVTLNLNPPYRYASGILSPIYCDNRLLLGSPQARAAIVNAFLETIKQHDLHFDIVAGTATAGIPWAALIAEKLNKPMAYVRAEAKSHGKKNQIEGAKVDGKTALLIEDLISTGGSSLAAVNALREAGATVHHCLAIFTYQMQTATDGFTNADCKLLTLSDFSALIAAAPLSAQDKETVQAWNSDPANWGKTMGLD